MDKLNRMKGTLKSATTKLENFVKDISESKAFTSTLLEVKIRKLQELQLKVSEIREAYYEVQDIENLPALNKEFEDIDDRLEEIEVSLNTFLISIKEVPQLERNVENNDVKKLNNMKVKLPEIPLPVFSGKYDEWSTFKVQFTNLIINNDHLNDTQKLYYLRASLNTEAKQLESADDSFHSLFTALTERFENHRLMVDTHIAAIINYEKIQHESAKELRKFVDCIHKNIRALKVLNYEQNDLSDAFLINILLQKVDRETRKLFEYTTTKKEYPKFAELISFLENRSSTLESVNRNIANKALNKPSNSYSNKTKTFVLHSNEKAKPKICILCKNSHGLNKCSEFHKMNVSERYDFVKQNKLCVNCLNINHTVKSCYSKMSCFYCALRHNSLLHREKKEDRSQTEAPLEAPTLNSRKYFGDNPEPISVASSSAINLGNAKQPETFQTLSNVMTEKRSVLLSTCFIFIRNSSGQRIRIRAVLDSCSNVNILISECAELLGFKRNSINVPIIGLNGSVHNIRNKINTLVSNSDETFKENMDFLLVPKITDVIPSTQLNVSNIKFPSFIEFADPAFFKPGKIHALIGAEFFYKILKHSTFEVNDKLTLQDSVFGWIPTGVLDEIKPSVSYAQCHLIRDFDELNNNLKQFWELESIGIKHEDSKLLEEDQAQNIFDRTVRFVKDRYEVELPWKRDWKELKDNFNIAKQRLEGLQRKFYRNEELYNQYSEIIKDYINQGIIEQVEGDKPDSHKATYYMPHHAVCKEDKLTTKVRIVFDASSHEDNCFYVDDLISGGKDLKEALEISRSAKNIMQAAGMTLRKWISNDAGLMENWKTEKFDTCPLNSNNNLDTHQTKVLGMPWYPNEDYLKIDIRSLFDLDCKDTKRTILQTIGKIFDPLGLISPFTVRLKCLIQELWQENISWDESLPPKMEKEWRQWHAELPLLEELKVPRLVLDTTSTEDIIEIHSFCDASKKAYGAAVYIRVKTRDGIYVNLITSKSRVAPLGIVAVPGLELLGALLSARLTTKVKEILDKKITSTAYYWTDSKIALYWIKGSTKRWKQFVANRVMEIKALTDSTSWFHCSTKDNPCDILSRGSSVRYLLENSMWFQGPKFLAADSLPVPKETIDVPETDYLSETKF
ncbi:uncharacterized protein LOC129226778 [Uloborus diversus]|uniref:uncharacterized protein LOC129226778 n=1 Tax=Uloborus diversus TaxID=327109 RepID=UPI00240A8A43|nr:uncharacterized protein LOC129226778 [Uloborus diversus]